jgi:peptidoglycan/xylan/chitin deacetylase (PgdA/CDA1 family)
MEIKLISKLPNHRRFCPSGWNGPLHHVRATVSGAICVPGLNSVAAKARTLSRFLCALLLLSLLAESIALANQANVFVYHRFNDSRYPSTNISVQDFRDHLELLREHDFAVLTLGEIVARMLAGKTLPERCAAITVDDAFRSFLTDGWPLLQEFGYPATLFVSTDSVGGQDYLNWSELKTLAGEGVEIGNHSAAHAYMLDNLNQAGWHQDVLADLQRSQAAFLENLSDSPQLFAYPYGEYSPELVQLVKQTGFTAAFGQQSGVITSGQNMFALPRFPMGAGFVALEEFRSKLFMNSLSLEIVSQKSPVVEDVNPPDFRFYLKEDEVVPSSMKCYVPGQTCSVDVIDGEEGYYQLSVANPLQGRRSKYTVTASDSTGRNWYWYSQLWVLPR